MAAATAVVDTMVVEATEVAGAAAGAVVAEVEAAMIGIKSMCHMQINVSQRHGCQSREFSYRNHLFSPLQHMSHFSSFCALF